MLAGEEAAFDRFADTYLSALYRFALPRLDGDTETARDIVQTTVCKAITKLSSFRFEASLLTWLCACCRNEILMHFRRSQRDSQTTELNEEVLMHQAPSYKATQLDAPDDAVIRQEASELVHIALDLLPAHYSRALEWKYFEKLPVREIADRLELGLKAAESLLTRSRNAFRERYQELSGSSVEGNQIMQPATGVSS